MVKAAHICGQIGSTRIALTWLRLRTRSPAVLPVTGNERGILVGPGSTVIGNTVTGNGPVGGIFVACPSNVTDNTAVNNVSTAGPSNLILVGDGWNNTNNVAT
jgi:hypothetical protein